MANQKHLDLLKQGVNIWNRWLAEQQSILPNTDLSNANLSGASLENIFFINTDLSRVDLSGKKLIGMNFAGTILSGANLSGANLSRANLSGADLCNADLTRAILVETNLEYAILTNCLIYGIAVWDVKLEGAEQINLVITHQDQPAITVDNLKVAQF